MARYPARAELLPAVRLGDDLVIVGDQLNDASMVRVTHTRLLDPLDPRLPDSFELTPGPERTSEELTLHIPAPADPNALSTWASGFYTLSLVVRRPTCRHGRPTPYRSPWRRPSRWSARQERRRHSPSPRGDTVTLTCAPRIRAEQERRVELMLGMQPVPITAITTPAGLTQPTTLRFTVPAAPSRGVHRPRARRRGRQSAGPGHRDAAQV